MRTIGGCAATGVRLDGATHRVPDTSDGGQNNTLRFVAGYWQGAPQQVRVRCHLANQAGGANTQQETVALSLALQADGTLRGVQTETVGSDECGARGAVLRVPVVATRVGDVPPDVALSDPGQVIGSTTVPATRPTPPVLGGVCSDVDKLGYDQTSNEQVVCEGNTWDKAPITTGVHAAGSSCDRPNIPVFAMSASNDGYLIECDPVSRMWTRHRGPACIFATGPLVGGADYPGDHGFRHRTPSSRPLGIPCCRRGRAHRNPLRGGQPAPTCR
jgi:serine/threonine-protein kinase